MAAAADMAWTHHLPVALARCLSNLTVEYNREDLEKALEVGREAIDVAARTGVAVWRDYTEANLMLALLVLGGWSELDERLERLQSTSIVAGQCSGRSASRGDEFEVPWPPDATPLSDDPADTAWIGFTIALAEWSTGRLEAALEHAVKAVDEMYAPSGSSDDFVHTLPSAEGQLRTAIELFAAWASPHHARRRRPTSPRCWRRSAAARSRRRCWRRRRRRWSRSGRTPGWHGCSWWSPEGCPSFFVVPPGYRSGECEGMFLGASSREWFYVK